MAYSNFTFDDLSSRLGLTVIPDSLFGHVAPLEPGTWLLETLERGRFDARFNEKSRSELVVAPILTRLRDFLGKQFAFFSGAELNVDPANGLSGECDFLLSRGVPIPFLQSPIMVVVEAKKGDMEAGLPLCAAQMLGSRIYNERAGRKVERIHGCVTTGDNWRFCRLEKNVLSTDEDLYYLDELGRVLGILVECMKGSDTK